MRTAVACLLVIASIFVCAAGARADLIDPQLVVPNTDLAGTSWAAPYADVTITYVNSTTANVSVAAYVTGSGSYRLGDKSAFAMNVSGTGLSVGTITAVNKSGSGNPSSSLTATSVDGFGLFNVLINCPDNNTVTGLSFTLTNTSGNWTNAASVLALNSAGYDLVGHVWVPGQASGGSNGSTYYAASPVPLPGALLLLAPGLAGLAAVRRRFTR